jgi:hypothetical protein
MTLFLKKEKYNFKMLSETVVWILRTNMSCLWKAILPQFTNDKKRNVCVNFSIRKNEDGKYV